MGGGGGGGGNLISCILSVEMLAPLILPWAVEGTHPSKESLHRSLQFAKENLRKIWVKDFFPFLNCYWRSLYKKKGSCIYRLDGMLFTVHTGYHLCWAPGIFALFYVWFSFQASLCLKWKKSRGVCATKKGSHYLTSLSSKPNPQSRNHFSDYTHQSNSLKSLI